MARGGPLRCGVSAGRRRRFVWVGVFGAASRAAVLLSIEPVVPSGEWSSPVDQDHPGDLWPESWASVFFGVTPAAGPGVVVLVISRDADHLRHRAPAARRDVRETKSRTPCRDARMAEPAREAVFDIEFLKKKPVAAVPISVTGSIS